MAKKYYCVKVGHRTGIFKDVKEYQRAIRGYPGFVARGFNSLEAANEFMELGETKSKVPMHNTLDPIDGYVIDVTDTKQNLSMNIGKKITAYVDGSYYEQNKTAAYAVVICDNKNHECCFNGTVVGSIKNKASSQIAEVIAATEAIKFAIINNCKKITIVYDCATIQTLADGGRARDDYAYAYQDVYKFASKQIDICFMKVTSHSSNSQVHQKYNNLADTAARSALSLKTKKTLQDHINQIIINR